MSANQSYDVSPPEDEELHQHDIKMEMHESLQRIEWASCISCKYVDTDKTEVRQIMAVSRALCRDWFICARKHHTHLVMLQLSKILDTLKKYCRLSFDLDEYNLKKRANELVERWCMITK